MSKNLLDKNYFYHNFHQGGLFLYYLHNFFRTVGTPVIVRLPQDDLTLTKKILEIGPDGVIFPMVTTAKDAERMIASTLYPPYGNRGFGPMNAIDYGFKNISDYVTDNHHKMCRFIQIEHKDAIENLDEIMQNPYIDGYIFGPNDLSGSYNMLGEVFSDKITNIMKKAIKKLHNNGKYTGVASGGFSEEIISHWSSFETEMLAAGADFDFLRDNALKNRKNLEKIHKHMQR